MAVPAADDESIDRAGRALHASGWSKVHTLDQMAAAWAALVAEVEIGYDLEVEDYTNDLTCRDWLAAAWPMLSAGAQAARQDELSALDERFRAATVDDTDGRVARYYRLEPDDGWWWRRVPTSRTGNLAETLYR
jgi:hypothetical protein